MVLGFMVPHFPVIGSRGVPPTILMSEWKPLGLAQLSPVLFPWPRPPQLVTDV